MEVEEFFLMEKYLLGRIGDSTVMNGTWNILPKGPPAGERGRYEAHMRVGLGFTRHDWLGEEDWGEDFHLGLKVMVVLMSCQSLTVVFPPACLSQDTLFSKVPHGSQEQNVLTVQEGFPPPSLLYLQTSLLNLISFLLKQVLRREKPREPGGLTRTWLLKFFQQGTIKCINEGGWPGPQGSRKWWHVTCEDEGHVCCVGQKVIRGLAWDQMETPERTFWPPQCSDPRLWRLGSAAPSM